MKKKGSILLFLTLAAAIMLFAAGCNDNAKGAASAPAANAETEHNVQVLGEGSTSFMLTVTDKEGTDTQFEIHTDQETVGEALKELSLIDGEEGEFGLYVKTVNGITADYDKDGVYWAFYINGEYATSGVDATEIAAENNYAFKVE